MAQERNRPEAGGGVANLASRRKSPNNKTREPARRLIAGSLKCSCLYKSESTALLNNNS